MPPIDRDESRYPLQWQPGDYEQPFKIIVKNSCIYWLQSASAALLGDTDIASYRFVNFGTLWHFHTLHIGLRLYEPAIALAAGTAFASGFMLAGSHLAKRYGLNVAGDDTAMGLMRVYLDRDKAATKPPPHWFFFWAALAAGILVKGPIAPAIAILTIGSLIPASRHQVDQTVTYLARPNFDGDFVCQAILVTIATDGAFLDIAVTGDFSAR